MLYTVRPTLLEFASKRVDRRIKVDSLDLFMNISKWVRHFRQGSNVPDPSGKYSIAGETIQNWLPHSLQDPDRSTDGFKSALKTHLLRRKGTISALEALRDALYKSTTITSATNRCNTFIHIRLFQTRCP